MERGCGGKPKRRELLCGQRGCPFVLVLVMSCTDGEDQGPTSDVVLRTLALLSHGHM